MVQEGVESRLARVRAVLRAGRRIADPRDPMGHEARVGLASTTGLSEQGIELALEHHLETSASEAEITALVAASPAAPRCHLVLAANVCTAPLRAVAVAVAAAPVVSVRPSRRDPVLARLLVEALGADPAFATAGGRIELVSTLDPRPGDHVHVYGSDESIAAVAATVGPEVRMWRHGTGLGLAVVGRAVAAEVAAEAVARDVVPFDQRGCLSPRFVLVEGGAAEAEAIAIAVDRALDRWHRTVPRGSLAEAEQTELASYRAVARALGPTWEGEGHLVSLDPRPSALWLAPALRVVPIAPFDAGTFDDLVSPWAPFVTIVGWMGTDTPALARSEVTGPWLRERFPRARSCALGTMQTPPLDGPVDLRASPVPDQRARS